MRALCTNSSTIENVSLELSDERSPCTIMGVVRIESAVRRSGRSSDRAPQLFDARARRVRAHELLEPSARIVGAAFAEQRRDPDRIPLLREPSATVEARRMLVH